jgi:hypothetical protein
LLDAIRSSQIDQNINESLSCTSTIATGSCPTSQEKDEGVISMTNFEEGHEDHRKRTKGVIFMTNFEEDHEDNCSIIADEESSVPLTPAGELLLTAALVEKETTTENFNASSTVSNTSTFGNAASWHDNQDACLEQISNINYASEVFDGYYDVLAIHIPCEISNSLIKASKKTVIINKL